jgi:hypothetical protein
MMFEKEAEEYADKDFGMYAPTDHERYAKETDWRNGAEFGYNKANEWHYMKDELPPEDVPLLCVRGGKVYVAWYYNGIYHDNRCCQVQKPYTWKEIVLPKESE